MFWIGLIVGAILALVGLYTFVIWRAKVSFTELARMGCVMLEAAENRESQIIAVKDDEILDAFTLETK